MEQTYVSARIASLHFGRSVHGRVETVGSRVLWKRLFEMNLLQQQLPKQLGIAPETGELRVYLYPEGGNVDSDPGELHRLNVLRFIKLCPFYRQLAQRGEGKCRSGYRRAGMAELFQQYKSQNHVGRDNLLERPDLQISPRMHSGSYRDVLTDLRHVFRQ
jgi:hypothetical protein